MGVKWMGVGPKRGHVVWGRGLVGAQGLVGEA